MGSIRFILFAVLIWLVWRMVSKFFAEKKATASKQKTISSEKMVMCIYCSTHLPEENALADNGKWFCDRQHKQLFLDKEE